MGISTKKRTIRILNFPMYCMMSVGMWRLKLPTGNKTFEKVYNVYSVLIQVYFPLFWTSLCIKFTLVMLDGNPDDDTFKDFSYVVGLLIVVIAAVFWQKKTVIRNILYVMEEEKTLLHSRDCDILKCHLAQVRFCRITSFALLTFALGIGVSVITETLWYRSKIDFYNQIHNESVAKPFAFNLYFVREFDREKYVAFYLFVEGISCIISDLMGTSAKVIFLACIMFVRSSLKRLQIKFRKMSKSHHVLATLRSLVVEHQRIIGFMKNLNDSIKYLILVEYLLNSLNVAAVSIQLILFDTAIASPMFYLCYLFAQIFIIGWSANEIQTQSVGLADALYESPWYDQTESAKSTILLMIMRAQKPLRLTIGPFDAMTTNTAVTVMKASYSYITLMSNKFV